MGYCGEGDSGVTDYPTYTGERPALSQLQRLLRFASVRYEQDLERIRHFGAKLRSTIEVVGQVQDVAWPSAYLKFEKLLLAALQRRNKGPTSWWTSRPGNLVSILQFVASQIPSETSRHSKLYYSTLAETILKLAPSLLDTSGESNHWTSWETFLQTILVPLTTVTGHTLDAYEAFGQIFMTLPLLSCDTTSPPIQRFRDSLAESINYKLLASALATSLKESGVQSQLQMQSSSSRLRLLGMFIYSHRYAHNFDSPEAYAIHKDFVTVVSLLLNSLPISILGDEDTVIDLTDEDDLSADVVTQFSREQVQSLVNQEGIGSLLAGSSQSSEEASEDEKIEEARQLANYALALLRFFPKRGDEIRMWLYIGPPDKKGGGRKSPAIKYFWEASKRSSVFATIFRDSRAAIGLLKSKTSDSSASGLAQHGFWQPAQQEINREAAIADEWRVILVFLELYTFVLKVTDDEEFFSTGQHDAFSTQVRDSGLL